MNMSNLAVAVAILAFSSICLAGPVLLRVARGPAVVPMGHARGVTVIPIASTAAAVPVDRTRDPVAIPIDPVSFQPYEFGYELGDGLGMTQHRREIANGFGAVRGSYGYQDPSGVTRVVEYRADSDGYRAVVRSNEPGISGQNAANAVFIVQPPPPAAVAHTLRARERKIVY